MDTVVNDVHAQTCQTTMKPIITTLMLLLHRSYTFCIHTTPVNPLKGRAVNWLHFAIQV